MKDDFFTGGGGFIGSNFVLDWLLQSDERVVTLSKDAPPFAETHPYEPNSPYSASKTSSDH